MNVSNLNEIDGNHLFQSFLAGASKIFETQHYLNKINVFPVADADTGTNMASTMRAIIEIAQPNKSVKVTADSISDAALTGARGNSGIIFAQFLFGFSNELQDKETVSIEGFAYSFKKAVRYAYEAIANPVDGTIISVIKDWADFISAPKEKYQNFHHFLGDSLKIARRSLKETTKKMDKLSEAKVVDAGAQGFVNFLEGMVEYFKTGITPNLEALKMAEIEVGDDHIGHDEITYRYCTEALLKGEDLSKEKLRSIVNNFGDSLVIAGNPSKMRVHIHTDTPWKLFEKLSAAGTIIAQKVDDMVLQNDVASHPKSKVALLTDSSVDLPKDILEKHQIQVIPLNVHFGETYYLDSVTIKPEQFYSMLDKAPIYPTTSQPSYKDFYNRYNYLATHYNSIIGINLSARLSGTWQNSLNAANKVSEQTGKTIEVINSKKVSGALGLLVLRAARELEKGISHDDVAALLPLWAHNTKQFALLKTLKYLVKSGRITRGKGLIGNLLNLKPLLEINQSGLVEEVGKTISMKKSLEMMMSKTAEYIRGKNIWGYSITHANNQENAHWVARKMEVMTGKKPEFIYSVTPVLITHVGIGALSLSILVD
ncbi:MAG: DegV family EDD domain-containing protein [Bacteroidales bacterium]|nr:DegV family EDD domain-containing protein [Bacteroidales bacterium]